MVAILWRVNDPTRNSIHRQPQQSLTWKEVTSIQAQATVPKVVNDFCSLGAICHLPVAVQVTMSLL